MKKLPLFLAIFSLVFLTSCIKDAIEALQSPCTVLEDASSASLECEINGNSYTNQATICSTLFAELSTSDSIARLNIVSAQISELNADPDAERALVIMLYSHEGFENFPTNTDVYFNGFNQIESSGLGAIIYGGTEIADLGSIEFAKVNITEFDLNNKLISGTFSADLIDDEGVLHSIRNGEFENVTW